MQSLNLTKDESNLLEKQNPHEKLSADRWAEACGVTMARSFRPVLLAVVVQRGYDEFERVCRPIYAGHGFSQRHFKRMFEIVSRTAELNPPDSHDINAEALNQ